MKDRHEVISAFLDDEPFDARALAEALSEPGGRELLIDLVALRTLVQPQPKDTPAFTRPRPPVWQALAAAAAVLIALASGYAIGERRSSAAANDPPAASRIVQAQTTWQDPPAGGMQ